MTSNNNQNSRLVYSTDPRDQVLCPHCRKLKDECKCKASVSVESKQYTVIFRIEKSGRGGKSVTVMDGFPQNESFVKDLTKEFKSKCGVGGTHKKSDSGYLIEIQGDQRVKLKAMLDTKGIRYKGM